MDGKLWHISSNGNCRYSEPFWFDVLELFCRGDEDVYLKMVTSWETRDQLIFISRPLEENWIWTSLNLRVLQWSEVYIPFSENVIGYKRFDVQPWLAQISDLNPTVYTCINSWKWGLVGWENKWWLVYQLGEVFK